MAKRAATQLARETYDMLLSSGAVVDAILARPAPQQRHKGVVPIEDLVAMIGVRATIALVRANGGRYLPTHRMAIAHLRHECIIRDWEHGLTNQKSLMAKYRCGHCLVEMAISEAKRRQRQRTAERLAGAEPTTHEPLVLKLRS